MSDEHWQTALVRIEGKLDAYMARVDEKTTALSRNVDDLTTRVRLLELAPVVRPRDVAAVIGLATPIVAAIVAIVS